MGLFDAAAPPAVFSDDRKYRYTLHRRRLIGSTDPKPIPCARQTLRKLAWWHGDVECLKLTEEGDPCHPLYLPASLQPRRFEWPKRYEDPS